MWLTLANTDLDHTKGGCWSYVGPLIAQHTGWYIEGPDGEEEDEEEEEEVNIAYEVIFESVDAWLWLES